MIVKLSGRVVEHERELIVLDVHGVGYGVLVSTEDLAKAAIGKEQELYIYEHIRENGYDLYGFTNRSAKGLFELLIGVNGVGPKGALAIMNVGNEGALRAAVAGGDTKYLSAASGIGKKVAERIVVDLKNKVGLSADEAATGFLQDLPEQSQDEAMQALVALGYSPADAATALRGIATDLPTDKRVTLALKGGK